MSGDTGSDAVGPRGAVDAALWAATTEASRVAAAQTLEALRTREVVQRLAQRYASVSTAHRAGHLFEVMHAHQFNERAMAAGSTLRAVVTEWVPGGSQTAAADLQVIDGGRVLADVQAKLYRSAPASAHELARDHYTGMQRLVAGDRLDAVRGLLDRRLTMSPEGLRFEDYRDTRAHLGARVEVGGVASDPISLAQAHRAADAPLRWANGQVLRATARQVGTAGLTAAALGGLAATASAMAAARAQEVSVTSAVASSCGAIAQSATVAGGTAALGEGVRLAAGAGALPTGLAGGALPLVVAGVAVDVARHGAAFARGELNTTELAARTAEVVGRSSALWAFTALGQTVVPVPVVGALAGAVVGQVAVGLVSRGMQMALAEARAVGAEESRIAALEREVAEGVAWSGLAGEVATALGAERDVQVAETLLPLLHASQLTIAACDWDGALAELSALTAAFGGQPLFCTLAEFDALMADEDLVLVLDPNPPRRG